MSQKPQNPWLWWLPSGATGAGTADPVSEAEQVLGPFAAAYRQFAEALLGQRADSAEQLQDALQMAIGELNATATQGGAPSWEGLQRLWGLSLPGATAAGIPGAWRIGLDLATRAARLPGAAMGFDRLLRTPAIGPFRERIEAAQALLRAWLEYQAAQQAYLQVLAQVPPRAQQHLATTLREQAARGQRAETLKAAFALWVDAGEQAYAEVAISEPFLKAQGRLTNALVAVKRESQHLVDDLADSVGLPTRRELDAAHQTTHELRRQLRALRSRVEALETAGAEA